MAKIKVLGDIIQITSAITEEQFERVKTFAPEAFIMKDADTGEEIFGVSRGSAFYSKYGVCFCSVDSEGKLFMTTNNPVSDHSDRDAEMQEILKVFAPIMAKLNMIEENVLNVTESLTEMEEEIKSSVEFI